MSSEPIVSSPLPLGTRVRMRTRHGLHLVNDIRRYGSHHRLWWLLPVVVIMFLIALAITTTSTALPVAVYTLF